MFHNLNEDGDCDGAFGFSWVTLNAAGFVEFGEGLGEVEEVGTEEMWGEGVDGVGEDGAIEQERFY